MTKLNMAPEIKKLHAAPTPGEVGNHDGAKANVAPDTKYTKSPSPVTQQK